MVQIELSKKIFERLQRHAVPLVDSLETVITRMADFYERGATAPAASTDKKRFSSSSMPDLRHTKVIAAWLNGVELESVNWNSLLIQAIRQAGLTAKNPAELKRLVLANFVIGEKADEGFRPMPKVGISVQGQDANSAAKSVFHIAQQRGWTLEVEILWREKEGAAYPGKIATLSNELVTST